VQKISVPQGEKFSPAPVVAGKHILFSIITFFLEWVFLMMAN
jgi:hypothetical protein